MAGARPTQGGGFPTGRPLLLPVTLAVTATGLITAVLFLAVSYPLVLFPGLAVVGWPVIETLRSHAGPYPGYRHEPVRPPADYSLRG
jgi:hypothetical protein